MPVAKTYVAVDMHVGLAWRVSQPVLVPVVLVMHVAVGMIRRLMLVFVFVNFRQDEARSRTPSRRPAAASGAVKGSRNKTTERQGAEEGRGREIGAGSRRAEMSQGKDKECDADAVAEEPDQPSSGDRRASQGARRPPEIQASRVAGPAMRPLTSTICRGSARETFRVRLLSRPHATQAPAMAIGPSAPEGDGAPVQESMAAPAAMLAIPARCGDRNSREKRTRPKARWRPLRA